MKLFGLFTKQKLRTTTPRAARQTVPLRVSPETMMDNRHRLDGVTYVLPKDIPEAHRLDFQHYLLHSILQADYAAPLTSNVSNILDVATGTGRWACEIARTFPKAQVVGLDMEETLQDPAQLPPNYQFVKGNLFAGLPFTDGYFDFVHQRFVVLALPAKQWPFILRELVRVTNTGGYIELVEGGGTFHNSGPATAELCRWWDLASRSNGIDVSLMSHLPALLQQAGLENISHQTFQVPLGVWGGRVGEMLKKDVLASLPAIKPFICLAARIAPETFDALYNSLSAEWEQYQTVYEYYLAYGQRVR